MGVRTYKRGTVNRWTINSVDTIVRTLNSMSLNRDHIIAYNTMHECNRVLHCNSSMRVGVYIASVVVIWIPATDGTDHPVAGCSESCYTFHCLMI